MKPIFSYSGIIGVAILSIVIVSLSIFGEHSFLEDFLSAFTLGPAAPIFSITISIGGLFLIFFYTGWLTKSSILCKLGGITGIISIIGIFLAIIFPSEHDYHTPAAQVLFYMAGFSVLFFTINFRKQKVAILGITVIITTLMLFFWVNPVTEKITAIFLGVWVLGLSISAIRSFLRSS